METTGTVLLTLLGPASPLTKGGDTGHSLGGDTGLSTETTGVMLSDIDGFLDLGLGDTVTESCSTPASGSTSSAMKSSGRVSWSSSSFILVVPFTTSRNLAGSVLGAGSGTPGRDGKSLAFMLNSGAGRGGSGRGCPAGSTGFT